MEFSLTTPMPVAGVGQARTPRARWVWFTVVWFAMAMAWVESAVVYYLRTMIDRIVPYQTYPLPIVGGLGTAEVVREAATLVMLLTVGILAGRNLRARLGYAAIAFGIWDIFYYVFLRVMTDWPGSLMDWDILFLIPLPWWGPVWAPVSIALLMVTWGTLLSRFDAILPREDWRTWGCAAAGMGVALYCFMADAMRVAGQGEKALRNLLPEEFQTSLFLAGLALMSAPILRMLAQLVRGWPNPAMNLNTESKDAGA